MASRAAEAEEAREEAQGRDVSANPIQHVQFSSFIIQ